MRELKQKMEGLSNEDLRRKLHNSRMENQQLRLEQTKMAKEI
mgnify:FL=1